MQIEKNKVCVLEYTLTDPDGEVIDSTDEGGPFAYLHGVGGMIVGLEEALEGKTAGAEFTITIPPEKAYGEYDEDLVEEVAREEFEGADEVEVGMSFEVEPENEEDESHVVTVVEVNDKWVRIDANHPLAGVALTFAVKVIEVRDGTPEEIEHGHVHGEGEEHHH